MNLLHQQDITCPYCGESIAVLIDCSIEDQQYIEDCQVCCRPISFFVESTGGGEPVVSVAHENE